METSSSGGSIETEAKELAVKPSGSSPAMVVTTVTPVMKQPNVSRSARGSKGIMLLASHPSQFRSASLTRKGAVRFTIWRWPATICARPSFIAAAMSRLICGFELRSPSPVSTSAGQEMPPRRSA